MSWVTFDQFNGQKPFVMVKRMEAFMLFATSFFHDPEFILTGEQYNKAGAALNKCLQGLDNWRAGDAEDPVTGWHPSRVLAAEMFEVSEEKVNDAQHAYALRLINQYRASVK